MIERTRYLRNVDGSKYGVITLLYQNGHFGAGISLCNTDEDIFNAEEGKRLAKDRALYSFTTKNLLMKDLRRANVPYRVARITDCNFPQSLNNNFKMVYKMWETTTSFIKAVDDMIYTIALAKVKADEVN